MLKPGDMIGLICCSNGKRPSERQLIERLVVCLEQEFQLQVRLATTIYQKNSTIFSGTAQERGKALMALYNDPEIKMIFDLSGGEVANEVLPYLDYTSIKYAKKPFVGYSDLTVMLNAIYAQTDGVGYNFQLLTILEGQKQKEQFRKAFINKHSLFFLRYEWLTPPVSFSKPVIGGNIRCFLKLAGTPYCPNAAGRVLLLEARGGKIEQMAAYFAQLKQIGILEACSAILLGQFTTIEAENQTEELKKLVLSYSRRHHFAVLKTNQIGHSSDSLPFPIGTPVTFS